MPAGDQWSLRDRAAAPVLARISADAERAPAPLGRLLRHVRDHLFDPALTVGSMVRACGYASRATADGLTRVVGQTAMAYITARRLETAQDLLASSTLRVAEIGSLVGIDNVTTFGRAVRRVFGVSPQQLRRAGVSHEAPVPAQGAGGSATEAAWAEMLAEWRRLDEHAARAQPGFDAAASAQLRADAAWNAARALGDEACEQLVTRAALDNPRLVDHLAEQSRIEGRGDRAHGVRMSALAVRAVPPALNHAWSAADIARARVRTRAWHANALRLALDFRAAEAILNEARHVADDAACAIPLDVLSEVLEISASLYLYWSKPRRAVDFSDAALALARKLGDPCRCARVLIGRAAIANLLDDFPCAASKLAAAEAIVESEPSAAELAFAVALNKSVLLTRLGSIDEASDALTRAQILVGVQGDRQARAHVRAMQGRLFLEKGMIDHASSTLSSACAELLDCGAHYLQVEFSFDLCLSWLRGGRELDAIEYVTVLMPFMQSIEMDRELVAAVRLLEDCLEKGTLRQAAIFRVRDTLARLGGEPGRLEQCAVALATRFAIGRDT